MTIERFREIFKDKVAHLTDEQIAEQIAQDRQLIHSVIEMICNNILTSQREVLHYESKHD